MARGRLATIDSTRLVSGATVVALFVVQLVWFPLPLGLWIDGLAPRRAGGDAGHRAWPSCTGPTASSTSPRPTSARCRPAFAAAFILFWGCRTSSGSALGLVLAVLLGVVVEMAIVRRFRHSPRLVAHRRHARHQPADGRARDPRPAVVGPQPGQRAHRPAARLEADDRAVHPQRQRPDRPRSSGRSASPAWRGSSAAAGSARRSGRAAERTDRAAMLGIPTARHQHGRVGGWRRCWRSSPCSSRAGISGVPIGLRRRSADSCCRRSPRW